MKWIFQIPEASWKNLLGVGIIAKNRNRKVEDLINPMEDP